MRDSIAMAAKPGDNHTLPALRYTEICSLEDANRHAVVASISEFPNEPLKVALMDRGDQSRHVFKNECLRQQGAHQPRHESKEIPFVGSSLGVPCSRPRLARRAATKDIDPARELPPIEIENIGEMHTGWVPAAR